MKTKSIQAYVFITVFTYSSADVFKSGNTGEMRETRIGNMFSKFTAIHRPGESFAVEFVVIKHFA